MKLNISTVLSKASSCRTVQERVDTLKQNDSFALKTILQYNFDTRLVSLLPEGAPPYNKATEQESKSYQGALHQEARKLIYFVQRNPPDNLNKLKRESLFIQLLEGLPVEDAEVVIAAKDRKLSKMYKGITEKVVRQAFPDILPG